MLQIYPYQCECGWHSEYITGGFRRVIPLVERVENQLARATHSNAKAIWRDIYHLPKEDSLFRRVKGFSPAVRGR
jgi:hypothetical protein